MQRELSSVRHRFERVTRLAATAFLLSSIAIPASAQTIRAVMHSDLRVTDPVITTAHITRNHAYMIYDTLLGMNEKFEPQPQMASWKVSDDGLTYTFALRDGLKFHDGAPVTADDVVASLKRWAVRDSTGQKLMDNAADLKAADPRTVVLTLKRPYAYTIETLAKPSAVPAFIMPKRVAETPPDRALTEYVGSGPFKFSQSEFQPGVRAVYLKNTDYVPRSEPSSWTAGGKVVKVDRVEWITMPDAQTAMNALLSGEIDYIEQPPIDLIPILSASDEIEIQNISPLGYQTIGRMNFLHPPFDNVKIRQAALLAMNQKDVLDALIGNPEYYKTCPAIFGCGTPLETDVGAKSLVTGGNVEAAKKLLQEAGYDGKPILIMQPTDVNNLKAQPIVAAQLLRKAGFNVDLQAMDWQTLVTRRANQKSPAEGGWNMFFTNWIVPEISNPLVNPMLNGRGTKGAWFGWPDDPKLEQMRDAYASAKSPEEQKTIARDIQAHAMETVNYIPLGQYVIPIARRKELTGVLDAPVPFFWNLEKKTK